MGNEAVCAVELDGVKDEAKVLLETDELDRPLAEKFIDELHGRGADVGTRLRRDSDIIFLALERREELDRMVGVLASLAPDGALWLIRPKGSNAISEREVMDAREQRDWSTSKSRGSPTLTPRRSLSSV